MTGKALANPLAAAIAAAKKSLPETTGVTATYARRLDGAGPDTVLVLDCSGSMSDSTGTKSKITVLREAVAAVCGDPSGRYFGPRLIVFSSHADEVHAPAAIPAPNGGTALHLGLARAATLRPRRTIVISDGKPDDAAAAFREADAMSGTIDVIYCGPDSDTAAKDFMAALAKRGGGRMRAHDIRRAPEALAPALRQLALPAR